MRQVVWALAGALWLAAGGMAEAQEFVRTERECQPGELFDYGPGIQCFRDRATDFETRRTAFLVALTCESGRQEECRAALGPSFDAYSSSTLDVVLSAGGVELYRERSIDGRTLFSSTTSSTETVTRVDTTLRETVFATRVTGQVAGGSTVFDLTLDVPVTDAAVQAAFDDAALAVTSAGGPGVVVLTPVLIERRETLLDRDVIVERMETADPVVTFTLRVTVGGNGIDYPIGQVVSVTSAILGDFGLCGTADRGDALPGDCANNETVVIVPFGFTFVNDNINTHSTILETTTGTETWEIFEHWEVVGVVRALGEIHAAVQSGARDLGQRLLRRMGDEALAPQGFALPSGDVTVSSMGGPELQTFGWVEGYASRGALDTTGGTEAERRRTSGLALGLTWVHPDGLTWGVALDHGTARTDIAAAGERADITLTQAALMLGLQRPEGFVSGVLSFGSGEVETTTTLGGLGTATYDLTTLGAQLEAGWHFQSGGWRLTPSVGLDWTRVRTGAFTAGGITAPAHEADRTRAFAGIAASRDWAQGAGVLSLDASARLVHVLGGSDRLLPVGFGGAGLTIDAGPDGRTGLDLGLGLTWQQGMTESHLGYIGRFRQTDEDHALTASLTLRW